MINNRLFKKINSIFWGIVSWLPIFLFLFFVISYSFTLDINVYGNGFNFVTYIKECFSYATNLDTYENFFTVTVFMEPITSFLSFFIDFNSNVPPFASLLFIQLNWYLIVQLFRLVVYVFMWFINFIYDLFDYLSLKRKEEN